MDDDKKIIEGEETGLTDWNFIPADPKSREEWYKEAWTKQQARDAYAKNPMMSNQEFDKILSMLYTPDLLADKATNIRTGQPIVTDDKMRKFYEEWLNQD